MRVLAVDHGEKRLGLAVSDATGTLARPLNVIVHTSRAIDAARVIQAAVEQGAGLIVIGQSFDEEGQPNAAGRRAGRFAEALRGQGSIPILLWDESMSSQDARAARLAAGVARKRRGAAVDAQAAAVILQSYLEAQTASTGKAKATPAETREEG